MIICIRVYKDHAKKLLNMAIERGEIVDVPFASMVIFHSYVNVYQKVWVTMTKMMITMMGNHGTSCVMMDISRNVPGGATPVISWFITPIDYSYIHHIP